MTAQAFPKPRTDLRPNTADFERLPYVKPTGFREYDARWLFPQEINLMGMQTIGMAMATLMRERGVPARIVTGHDYRSYSSSIKYALISGMLAGGAEVHDIGLALSPMAYFAQFALEVEGVAMVTASHNDNGWTGIKMGMARPLTFGPEDMSALKDLVLEGRFTLHEGGSYRFHADIGDRYMADLTNRDPFKRKLKVVVACGNGTAGAFAPQVLKKLGCEVVALNTDLDYNFPNHNPNPEALKMLHAVSDAVRFSGADVGLAFDGDGDRCGVVDNEGTEIFADKVGVMLARDISASNREAKFVVDVKSTGLFTTDPVLRKNGAHTTYWKTGHSYIKRYSHETGALVGFENRGITFSIRRLAAVMTTASFPGSPFAICFRTTHRKLWPTLRDLPKTWQSPTMSPHCDDEKKYGVVDRVIAHFKGIAERGEKLAGQPIRDVVTVNGIRIMLADGTWGLVRASSNKPELVVVVESPVSEANMRAIFAELDAHLATYPEIGEYNQKNLSVSIGLTRLDSPPFSKGSFGLRSRG